MRFTFTASWCSLDVTLFETPDEDEQVRAVAGSPWAADSTIAAAVDPLQRADELPDGRGGFGVTG